jgi:hypothetical protein
LRVFRQYYKEHLRKNSLENLWFDLRYKGVNNLWTKNWDVEIKFTNDFGGRFQRKSLTVRIRFQ